MDAVVARVPAHPRWGARRRALGSLGAAGAALLLPGAARAQSDATAWPRVTLIDGGVLQPPAARGDACMLVVWATHCPFCRRHNAHVEKLHRAAAGLRLQVVTAALDRDVSVVRGYLREHGYTFPVTLQAEALRAAFGLTRVIPMTCTFDRTGRLLQRIPGEMFEEDVLELRRLAA